MTRTELEAMIAAKTGCTKAVAHKTFGELTDAIIADVAAGKGFSVVGFGSFKLAKKAAREARNPRTGETIKVPAHKTPVFKAGKAFKEACNKKKKK